jgi:hypothetical protein
VQKLDARLGKSSICRQDANFGTPHGRASERLSDASSARSARVSLGREVCRRRIASSWRRTSISTSFERCGRPNTLWSIRWKLGALLGWDRPDAGLGFRVPTSASDCRPICATPPAPDFQALPFSSLYLLDDEFATEVANRTVHGSCTWAGCATRRTATAARWPSW